MTLNITTHSVNGTRCIHTRSSVVYAECCIFYCLDECYIFDIIISVVMLNINDWMSCPLSPDFIVVGLCSAWVKLTSEKLGVFFTLNTLEGNAYTQRSWVTNIYQSSWKECQKKTKDAIQLGSLHFLNKECTKFKPNISFWRELKVAKCCDDMLVLKFWRNKSFCIWL